MELNVLTKEIHGLPLFPQVNAGFDHFLLFIFNSDKVLHEQQIFMLLKSVEYIYKLLFYRSLSEQVT